ncbi:SLC13 family permease [Hoylesella timonensis]|uniref:SLC13 family permease n=1 Tax=Hoylesella timonensis TaxID=386414 RepID=UPI0018982365|nr:SLC13 family permease [Hoylesella timonensis]
MEQENANILGGQLRKKNLIEFICIVILTAIVWNLPTDIFGIEGLTIVQQRIIAIFVFATLSWITEAIPSWATSLAIITIMCLTVSNNSLAFFKGEENDVFGTLLKSKEIMATFANPVIMLFLGGFILAIAATKSGLDVLLAKNLIKPFGKKSENVLLGFLLITGVFSMFVSNTATAAMMLTFLTPVFAALPASGKGRIALTLSIPVAANLGGMATPIGTPPNAIALQALNNPDGLNLGIDFGEWMAFMFPLVIVLLLISWRIILNFFPFTQKTIELEIKGNISHGWRMWVVCATFILTILLWLTPRDITGIDSNTVAMVPMGIFAVTGVITGKDLQAINWSVIWMVAGGFALGLGMNGSGLADRAIESIPFHQFSPIIILILSGLICYFLSNFISNTATAALLVPILAVVCSGMGETLNAIGGTATILIGIAIAASSAMCLPISTPPNAIAYSTGLVRQNDMLKIGLTVGIISMILGYFVLFFIGGSHFL